MNLGEFEMTQYVPLLLTLVLLVVILGALHYLLIQRHTSLTSEERFPRQLILLGLSLLALIILIIATPLSESTRNQILALLGIIVSGVIAFSSASFVRNFMAAVVLRVTHPFRVGDFVTIDGQFGKVVARGLLDTEIQIETRELIAIPNANFTSRPVTVARRSGIIVTRSVSLGYDISHSTVEPLLLRAAENTGLEDPYVHIIELGNFAISYQVAGLLKDVERILTTRSELNRQILDVVHHADLEIISPSVTRHINLGPETHIIPETIPTPEKSPAVEAEKIAFDKARALETIESEKQKLLEQIELQKKNGDKESEHLQQRLQALKDQEKELKDTE
ncbi:MAG: mechanosensitive ion channel domain-containing protein [Pseudomonadota bacterium]